MTTQTLNRFEWLKAVNRSDLLPRAKVVASALAVEFCNAETGRLDPSLTTLADAAGQTVDTVKRAIRDLTEGGWLARTEGRGRGNKTAYTLLSPGKVVDLASAKKGAAVHRNKGGTEAPLTKQKGAPVQAKGGTGAPSYNKDQQTKNKEGASPETFRHFQFSGKPFPGATLVSVSKIEELAAWGRWLMAEGFPALSAFPIKCHGAKKGAEFFALPYEQPPTGMQATEDARAYFAAMHEPEGVRYAAE